MANDLFALLQLVIRQFYPTKFSKGILYDCSDGVLADQLFLIHVVDALIAAFVYA